jgi:hypothetical protein
MGRSKLGVARGKPGGKSGGEAVELSSEEMIGATDENKMICARQGAGQSFHGLSVAELVALTVKEELGLGAGLEVGKVGVADGGTQADEFRDSGVFATDTQADPATEAEPREEKREAGKFASKKVDRGANVILFTSSSVVFSFAQTGAAEIETENGKMEGVEGLRHLIDDFVVHGAAEKGMRVANECGEGWTHGPARGPEDGFEAPGRAVEEERAMVVSAHDKGESVSQGSGRTTSDSKGLRN